MLPQPRNCQKQSSLPGQTLPSHLSLVLPVFGISGFLLFKPVCGTRFGRVSKQIHPTSPGRSLVSSTPSVQAGLLELLPSCLPRFLAASRSCHWSRFVSQTAYSSSPLHPKSICSPVLPTAPPTKTTLSSLCSGIIIFHATVDPVSTAWQVVRILQLEDWSWYVLLSWSFILPYIVYSQILEDCTFCLIMLETDWHFSCYSLWERGW